MGKLFEDFSAAIIYSPRYECAGYTARHITLDIILLTTADRAADDDTDNRLRELWYHVCSGHLLSERECDELGIVQSPGWTHVGSAKHITGEQNVLLFRRGGSAPSAPAPSGRVEPK